MKCIHNSQGKGCEHADIDIAGKICYIFTYMKYLQSHPGIAQGELTLKGTRILVADAITMLAHGYTIDELHETWPHVPITAIRGAIEEATQHLSPDAHAETVLQT